MSSPLSFFPSTRNQDLKGSGGKEDSVSLVGPSLREKTERQKMLFLSQQPLAFHDPPSPKACLSASLSRVSAFMNLRNLLLLPCDSSLQRKKEGLGALWYFQQPHRSFFFLSLTHQARHEKRLSSLFSFCFSAVCLRSFLGLSFTPRKHSALCRGNRRM